MTLRMATLASGSDGNCIFAEADGHRVLIDAGISCRTVLAELKELEVPPESIEALLLTHEHSDHVKGLPAILRKLDIPVYATEGTFEALSHQAIFERLPKGGFRLIRAGESFSVGSVRFQAIPTSHDCLEPVAFRGDAGRLSFAVVTDLGSADDDLTQSLGGLDALLLEANHNIPMLESGPYPYPLKIRIRGSRGHLSNEDAAALLTAIWHPGLSAVLLGHISKINNYPLLALETVRSALKISGIPVEKMKLTTAPATGLSEVITVADDKKE